MTVAPLTPSVLAWAIREDGRALPDIADAVGVEVDTLDAWLSGDMLPTKGQVTQLAEKLNRPRSLFFMPRPPAQVGLPTDFRHPPGSDREVSPGVARKVRTARRLQQALSWARSESTVDIPAASIREAPWAAAARVRQWVDVSTSHIARTKSDLEALGVWRETLEDLGVLVFALQIGEGEVRGFSSWDASAPLIVMNTSGVSPAARSFSIAHELGHLALRQDSACFEILDGELIGGKAERWCEAFGASFLMPEDAVRERVAALGLDLEVTQTEDAAKIARAFRTSLLATAVRLRELNLASASLIDSVRDEFKGAPRTQGTPRNPPRPIYRLRQLGPRTLQTVLDSFPPEEALSLLRLTAPDVRELSDQVRAANEF